MYSVQYAVSIRRMTEWNPLWVAVMNKFRDFPGGFWLRWCLCVLAAICYVLALVGILALLWKLWVG